jgi:hypothetical protein
MKWLASVTSANLITALLGVLALVAGVALLLAAGGIVASVVGIGLLGASGIAFVALAFLLVGESEERDRLRRPRG